MQTIAMSVTAPPEEYVGQLLYLKAVGGWGWHGVDDNEHIDNAFVVAAGGCHIQVLSFFSWHNEVRGVIGKVEESGHVFDGLWIVCAEMLKGEHDFTEHLCLRYDLEIGRQAPSEEEWPRIRGEGRLYAGYGILAETEQHIRRRIG